MKTFLIACFSLMLVMGIPQQAEAKRFGGGFSLGKSFTTQKKVAPAPTKQTTTSKSDTAQAGSVKQPAKPGMGGLFGGLLAGGLLGALIFGGAFEGIQFMDILLIGLVLFFLVRLLGGRRQPAYAGAAGASQESTEQAQYRSMPDSAPAATSAPSAADDADPMQNDTPVETPEWFDADAFVSQAPQHFEQLQRAWDEQDWNEISEYTSAELLAQLKTNRAVLPEQQETEVVSCMAELVGFQQQSGETIVSIHFHGWIREQNDQEPNEFSEIWHLNRVETEVGVNWVILGIEQP